MMGNVGFLGLMLVLQVSTVIASGVQFSCGDTVCPQGMDCLTVDGTSRCADPCEHYTVLNDSRRSAHYERPPGEWIDDSQGHFQGWYRLFLHGGDAQLPDTCVEYYKCGTNVPLYITSPHPHSNYIQRRDVCGTSGSTCCSYTGPTTPFIYAKRCYGQYYVYKLKRPYVSPSAYCTVPLGNMNMTTPGPAPTVPGFSSGKVRLVNGENSCSGRVEIFFQGQWGTVCDDGSDMDNAQVVCRQLGCARALSAPWNARFGQGTGPIWMDDVACSGQETALSQCEHRGIGVHDCYHHEDAGVICEDVIFVLLQICSGRSPRSVSDTVPIQPVSIGPITCDWSRGELSERFQAQKLP